jgi:predicted ester cyclase
VCALFSDPSDPDKNKALIREAVREVFNAGHLQRVDDLYAPAIADGVKRWVEPFRRAFPDVEMEIVDLIAEGEKVVCRFACSGTHEGEWRGHPPTGRRFERIDEVYIFTVRDGRIVNAWGIEDTLTRLRQLGLPPS